jgi:hypothetical protein
MEDAPDRGAAAPPSPRSINRPAFVDLTVVSSSPSREKFHYLTSNSQAFQGKPLNTHSFQILSLR